MRIVLIRHGRPAVDSRKWMTSFEFGQWIDSYNAAELCDSVQPPNELFQLVQNCNSVVCSNLHRSLSSAKRLEIKETKIIRDHQFREMEMPWGRLSGLKLKPNYWSIIFRLLWVAGYSKNSESFKDATLRARQAALTLESLAKKKRSVLFVGHGMLNRAIAESLVKRGWETKRKLSGNYWGVGVFEREG